MDLSKLFSLGYLFQVQPGAGFDGLGTVFTVYFLIFVLGGLGLTLMVKFWRKNEMFVRAFRGFGGGLFWYGVGGFIFMFFRNQGAPYLSMRIWFLLYVVWTLYVLYAGVKSRYNDLQSRASLRARRGRTETKDYLPKKKK